MRNVAMLAGLMGATLALIVGCGGGGGVTDGPSPSTATVQGQVRDASDDQPLEGVTVTVGGKSDNTKEQGQFSISQVPTSCHPLSVSKPGYETAGSLPSTVCVEAPTTVLDPIYMIDSGYIAPPGPPPPGP